MDNWYILHISSSIYLIKADAKCMEQTSGSEENTLRVSHDTTILMVPQWKLKKFVQSTGNEPNSSLANSLKVTFHLKKQNKTNKQKNNKKKQTNKKQCNSVNAKLMWSGDIKTVENVF